MILSGAMLGAFYWALGSTFSLILLERDPWLKVKALAMDCPDWPVAAPWARYFTDLGSTRVYFYR